MDTLEALKTKRLVFESENWTVHEPHNRMEARLLGREQWCTAKEGPHYDLHYRKNLGDLYVFFRRGKVRPQYQMFVRRINGLVSTEFRDGGNLYANIRAFVTTDAPELRPFWDGLDIPFPDCISNVTVYPGLYLYPAEVRRAVDYVLPELFRAPNIRSVQHNDRNGNLACDYVHTRDELPQVGTVGQLAYVAADRAFYLCQGNVWERIEANPAAISHTDD